MSKILIFKNTPSDFEFQELYIKEVVEGLINTGHQVHVYDVKRRTFMNFNNRTSFRYFSSSVIFKYGFLNIFLSVIALLLFGYRNRKSYDYTNFMYCRLEYMIFAKLLMKISKVNHATIFGNIFKRKIRLIKIYPEFFKKIDLILVPSEDHRDFFVEFMEKNLKIKFSNKTNYAELPVPSLDIMEKLTDDYVSQISEKLNIPQGNIVIIAGTCADTNEQHLEIINELSLLDKSIYEKITFIFPLTYPKNPKTSNYINELKNSANNLLKTSQIIYLEEFLKNEEFLALFVIGDVFINCRKTDQLAASIFEALYSDTLIITGKWLKYDKFIESNNIFLIRIDKFQELHSAINDYISNRNQYLEKIKKNKTIIKKRYNKELIVSNWCSIYN